MTDTDAWAGDEGVRVIYEKEVARLFFHLLDRAVVEDDVGWRVLCLRAMRLLFERFPKEVGRDRQQQPPTHTLAQWPDVVVRRLSQVAGIAPVRFAVVEMAHTVEWYRSHHLHGQGHQRQLSFQSQRHHPSSSAPPSPPAPPPASTAEDKEVGQAARLAQGGESAE